MNIKKYLILLLLAAPCAQAQTPQDSVVNEQTLHEAGVSVQRRGQKSLAGPQIGLQLSRTELFRAACCNLGESFSTNASVDVNYADAATGAKQIRLLGLSGTYVQMLTENIPSFRGAALPYSLDYVPGPWMQSIQISKGNASVKNGAESIAGQINVQYLPPEGDPGATLNVYGDSEGRIEANADASMHVSKRADGEVLLHYENRFGQHDANGDTFRDMAATEQYNFQTRWRYASEHYIFHGGGGILSDKRTGGQTTHIPAPERYVSATDAKHYEAFMKHAIILSHEHEASIALMGNAVLHDLGTQFGLRTYDVKQTTAYASLVYETKFHHGHALSAGASLNYDLYDETACINPFLSETPVSSRSHETTPGLYAQYTFSPSKHFTLMAGMRGDYSSTYGFYWTPRMHLMYKPIDELTLRAVAGKGYRSPHALAENHFLLSSARRMVIESLPQEESFNTGLTVAYQCPVRYGQFTASAEYFYTNFLQQAVVNREQPGQIIISALDGRSYSHVWQADASYPVAKGLTLTAAYRYQISRSTYNHIRLDRPLESRHKGLFTVGYKTPLGLWQIDATLAAYGKGRMPTPYIDPTTHEAAWAETYPARLQLNLQVTRWFRHCSVYVGGENLTHYRQKNPIIDGANALHADSLFDATMIWGPVSGAMAYAGLRWNIGR